MIRRLLSTSSLCAQWLIVLMALLLFIGSIIAWARSHRAGDHWHIVSRRAGADGRVDFNHTGLWWGKGRIILYHARIPAYRFAAGPLPPDELKYERMPATEPRDLLDEYREAGGGIAGLYLSPPRQRLGEGARPGGRYVVIPFWMIVLITIIPSAWLGRRLERRRVRRRRLRRGWCAACGYDLRASGAVCPECGSTRGA